MFGGATRPNSSTPQPALEVFERSEAAAAAAVKSERLSPPRLPMAPLEAVMPAVGAASPSIFLQSPMSGATNPAQDTPPRLSSESFS